MIYNNLTEISDNFDLFLFDAYGVFYEGTGFYENSRETMRNLLEQGKTDLLRKSLLEKSIKFSSCKNPRKYYVIGEPHKKAFAGTDYEQVKTLDEADFVYCGVPYVYEKDWEKSPSLREQFLPFISANEEHGIIYNTLTAEPFENIVNQVLQKKLPALNANPDFTAKEGHPLIPDLPAQFVVRNGTIAEMLRQGGGEVLEFGKPHTNIYDFAFNILENNGIKINKSRTCMIGDTVRTDIKGAVNAGVAPVLCVETGVTAEEISRGNTLENLCTKENIALEQVIQIKSVGGK